MGFSTYSQLLSHYYEAAEIILWQNPNVLIGGKPIDPKNSPFKHISNNLYYIADLYSNFNSANYPQNRSIQQGEILSSDLLNARFNTQITQCEWTNITNQIINQHNLHNILCQGHNHVHPTIYYIKTDEPRYYYKIRSTDNVITQNKTTTITPQLHILKETGFTYHITSVHHTTL